MTVQEWLGQATLQLAEAGIPSPRLEAEVLLARAMDLPRVSLFVHPEAPIPIDSAEALLHRRLGREPLAYIVGHREFYGRRFAVDSRVLIPRHETELLVNLAVASLADFKIPTLLDVGTGSGCLAVTIALEMPTVQVTATDISEAALQVARANAFELGAKVEFVNADLWPPKPRRFDIIVSNPPYIDPAAELMPEVRAHEPSLALFAEDRGLAIYRRLAETGADLLTDAGRLIVELGDDMAAEVTQLFQRAGWQIVSVHPDLGGMPRALVVCKPNRLS